MTNDMLSMSPCDTAGGRRSWKQFGFWEDEQLSLGLSQFLSGNLWKPSHKCRKFINFADNLSDDVGACMLKVNRIVQM